MSKLQQAREFFDKANDIKGSGTSLLLEFKQKYQQGVEKIQADKNLSGEGRMAAKAELKKQLAVPFLQKTYSRKQEMLANVRKAIRDADEVVYAKAKKPDAIKVQRFEEEIRELKTQLLLSPNADRGLTKLRDFVGRIDDAYLAGVVRDQFAEFSSTLLAAPGTSGEIKAGLAGMFDHLKTAFETEEAKQARNLMESAKRIEDDPRMYLVFDGGDINPTRDLTDEIFGRQYTNYINDTDGFFAIEENTSLKPADYVEPKQGTSSPIDDELRREFSEARRKMLESYDAVARFHGDRAEKLQARIDAMAE